MDFWEVILFSISATLDIAFDFFYVCGHGGGVEDTGGDASKGDSHGFDCFFLGRVTRGQGDGDKG
jgi:hypothetical protein